MSDSTRPLRKKSKPKTGTSDKAGTFERNRRRLDKKREERRLSMQWAHFWNLCPKCGGDMFEQKSLGIYFDVCRDCHSLLIESAELSLAVKHRDPKKFLKALLDKSKKPKTE